MSVRDVLGTLTQKQLISAFTEVLLARFEDLRNPYGQTSIKLGETNVNDELVPLREFVAYLRKANPLNYYSICRRGRGSRVAHETYAGEYQKHLPLDKAERVAIYLVERPKR